MEIKEKQINNRQEELKKELKMYFYSELVKKFAKLEQNEKNFKVAEIVDRILIHESEKMNRPIFAVELGGGAHPDRYHKFFKMILENPKGHIDWVDLSPHMLEMADDYLESGDLEDRKEVISYIQKEITEYLRDISDEKLDIAIMKYTFSHIKDIDEFFGLLKKKLKSSGVFVATAGETQEILKSHSTNARFLYNGEEIPDGETRKMKDGDTYSIKFFKVSGDPSQGYLEGAETTKYYHSVKKIKNLAEKHDLDVFVGDWKDFLEKDRQDGEELDQDVLVLRKK